MHNMTHRMIHTLNFRDPDGSLRRNLEYIAQEMAREFGGKKTLADAANYAAQHLAGMYRQIERERRDEQETE